MFKKFQYSEAKSQKKKKMATEGVTKGLQGVGHRQRNDFGWRCPRKRLYLRYAAG